MQTRRWLAWPVWPVLRRQEPAQRLRGRRPTRRGGQPTSHVTRTEPTGAAHPHPADTATAAARQDRGDESATAAPLVGATAPSTATTAATRPAGTIRTSGEVEEGEEGVVATTIASAALQPTAADGARTTEIGTAMSTGIRYRLLARNGSITTLPSARTTSKVRTWSTRRRQRICADGLVQFIAEPSSSAASRRSPLAMLATPRGHEVGLTRRRTNDDELRRVFSRFGSVQTCIVNSEKRHAFIKMISRKDAIAAKEGMERDKPPDLQLRVSATHARPFVLDRPVKADVAISQTRWGVGFGPRDCSDYTTGISIIPIARLTEADRKWMLTAEFGGSGGKAIEGGLVVEEPDIEIGAGVSSKGAVQARASISNLAVRAIKHADLEFSRTAAISRRVTTDHSGGRRGARSNQDSGRARRHERPDGPDPDSVNAAPLGQPGQASGSNAAPALSNFPFPFANILPPGFILPGMPQQQQQSQQQPSP